MKNVLLFVRDDEGQDARLAAALDLVTTIGGHLDCLDVADAPHTLANRFAGPVGMLALRQEHAANRHNHVALQSQLIDKGVSFSWRDSVLSVESGLIQAAGLADIVVMSAHLPSSPEHYDTGALIRSIMDRVGTPVLAVPPHVSGFDPRGEALVLWDGSDHAEAALRAAVPLLSLAREVTLVYVDDRTLKTPLREATDYLSKLGIVTHATRRAMLGASTETTLERVILRTEPAFVVMGAYGTGRLREALFGSVTSHLLATCKAPLLLARSI